MKNSRRIFAALLAVLVAVSLLTVGVYAAGTPNGNENMQVVVKTDTATGYPGDYVTVTLNITNNYYASSMRFPVLFTKGIFEIEEASLNLQKLGQLTVVTGSLSANTTGSPSFYPAGYSPDDYGVVLVQWLGTPNAGLFGCYNQPDGGDAISFRLKVKTGANAQGTILIPPESSLFYRQGMNDPADGNTVYSMTAGTCPMTFTDVVFNRIGQAPDIAAVDGSATVIDRVNGLIYGLSAGLTSLDANLVGVGGATLEVIKSSGAVCGTGTVVNVKNGGVTINTFKVVVFGDVNGDGTIDSLDAGTLIDFENYLVLWVPGSDDCYLTAGNINGDTTIDSLDAGNIIDYENYLKTINQVNGLAS